MRVGKLVDDSLRIAIVGAGIGGLAAALALIRRRFDVKAYEQAPQITDIGAGLQLSANGTRVLADLGLSAEIRSVACAPEGKQIRLWNTGQTWKLFDLGAESVARYGHPYLTVHRADLHSALHRAVEKAAPGAVVAEARCIGFEQWEQRVLLHFASGGTASADILVGADGVHSRVRQALFGDGLPSYTGCMAWRGLVPASRLPQRLMAWVGTNWVGPGAHVITYPVRRGELLNFVGIVERDDWKGESWTDAGTTGECAADFPGWHADVHEVIRNVDTPYKWALISRAPLPTWTDRRVTLLGDASHPTLPMLAQGANMALEDGLVLARSLEQSRADPLAALRRYEAARIDRTTRIVRASAENAKRFHNPALAHQDAAAAYVAGEWQEERARARYEWLFEYDAVSVPV
jgi:salicylate hydroxylase